MRIFIAFEDVRLPLDVQPGQTVGDVKQVLRDHFKVTGLKYTKSCFSLTYCNTVISVSVIFSYAVRKDFPCKLLIILGFTEVKL